MDDALTSVSDLVLRPMIPAPLIIALALLAFALIAFGLTRGLKGAWLRFAALAALVVALLDPAATTEDRRGLADVVALVVDESASQSLETRAEDARAAADALTAKIEALSNASRGGAPIEVRRISVKGDEAAGTTLLTSAGEALSDLAPGRLSAVIAITDGAVSDADLRPSAIFGADADAASAPPVHVLLTGREDEFDRRLVVETAPAYGLVGEPVTMTFRIEESGDAERAGARRLSRVEAIVDGRLAAAGVARIGRSTELTFKLEHPGVTVVELRLEEEASELTTRNNVAAFAINGVRDRLKVLLISGEPYAGERTWRNLLKSDPSVDLAHFTILRPPSKTQLASRDELALIPFPTGELFGEKVDDFDLIIFDRYRRWGILYESYIQNIANYVRRGGAVLVSTGPAFAGFESMYRSPLRDILPAAPTRDVVEGAFRPGVTALGHRHPVTRALPGSGEADADPTWGRWFRLVELAAFAGDVVMEGPESRPLLVLDRVGKDSRVKDRQRDGRVAMLATDQVWLWARGYDGGGPQAELLRRLSHWLMKEPELEEESLTAEPRAGGFVVERRSLAPGAKSVLSTGPDGAETEIPLERVEEGVWRAVVKTDVLGVHRLTDADASEITLLEDAPREPLDAIAVVGPPSPAEFADPVSRADLLQPAADLTGGAIRRLTAGVPDLRRTREGRATQGSGWIGVVRRDAYLVEGVSLSALAPSWLFFAIAAAFAVAAWRVEGR